MMFLQLDDVFFIVLMYFLLFLCIFYYSYCVGCYVELCVDVSYSRNGIDYLVNVCCYCALSTINIIYIFLPLSLSFFLYHYFSSLSSCWY